MAWNFAYTPQIWPSGFTALLLIALAVYSWRQRGVPGALPFMIAVLLSAAWAAGSVLEYAAVDLETRIFWIRFQTTWQLPAVTTVTRFVLEYSWPGCWLTRRNLVLLSIAPLLFFGLIWSDDRITWCGAALPWKGRWSPPCSARSPGWRSSTVLDW